MEAVLELLDSDLSKGKKNHLLFTMGLEKSQILCLERTYLM